MAWAAWTIPCVRARARRSPISTIPRVTQAIAGLEYKGDCCWVGRVVYQRYAVSAKDANSAVFFQLELTGLGALGTDPMNLLNRSIPGYSRITRLCRTGPHLKGMNDA